MGKTSIESRFNVPGKIGWAIMETPGYVVLLYCMYALPKQEGIESLPLMNWAMAGMFVRSYSFKVYLHARLLFSLFTDHSLYLPVRHLCDAESKHIANVCRRFCWCIRFQYH